MSVQDAKSGLKILVTNAQLSVSGDRLVVILEPQRELNCSTFKKPTRWECLNIWVTLIKDAHNVTMFIFSFDSIYHKTKFYEKKLD